MRKIKKSWLNGKTVIISGASGGIGFEVTKILIEKYDCSVIGIARNEKKLLAARETLGELKDRFSYYLFDVSVKENWVNFVNDLTEKGIVPDVLLNNAGFMLQFAKFEKFSEQEIDEIINTNLVANIYSIKLLLPLLKQSKTPAIMNISSAAGVCPVVGESLYCATKYAMRGFTETLIQDYKKQIYIGGVYPGFIRTNILNRMSVTDKNNKLINKIMTPVEKAAKKITRGLHRHKKRVVIGWTGHAMHFFGRIMPATTANIITKVLKWSKLELFSEVFEY